MKFEKYYISAAIKKNLSRIGFKRPTDIQFKSIPSIMKGEDVLAIAQTGTGKTAAFVLPMLDAFGISWMHFGLILTVNLAIGYCTPPMGVSLYITGSIANKDIIYVSKAVLPFIAIQIAVLFLITYMPDLVLWLPNMMGFSE